MSLKARILIGFLALFGASFYLIADSFLKEMRPRYLEAVEESLIDTSQTLASLMETQARGGRIDATLLSRVFALARERRFTARIFGYVKTRPGLNVYVTDAHGTVVYDSRGDETLGRDYSRWNDVHHTLRGVYGARATRADPKDPASSLLYVAAPIHSDGRVIGVITVIKPQDSVSPFIEIAKRKMLTAGLLTILAVIALSVVLSFWVSRPLTRLGSYVRSLKDDGSARLPSLGVREIKDLGREFESLWEELKGKKYVDEYVQSLTHELKSPLTSIRGSAELLEEEMPAEQRLRFTRTIVREALRMEEIIRKMLELSALENRRTLGAVETVRLASLVDELAEGYPARADAGAVTIFNRVEREHAVQGEGFLISHALSNLLDNAVRFSPPGGAVVVSSLRTGGAVRVTISDEGPGIPDYALEKIFARFYSLPAPGGGKKGTGLGLSFVREAAALHGGSVSVRNNPGNGVTATLELPVQPPR